MTSVSTDPITVRTPINRNTVLALSVITACGALLYGWCLAHGGTNLYYTAAVRTMASDWHAFALGTFDPGGFITTDKLPGAFWIQALFVRAFGFHSSVVLLPQVLAATVTIPLLFAAVRRWAGTPAGLVAAAVFALTPITVALAHVNIPDTFCTLFLVAAAWAFGRALESGRRTLWLVACAVFIGIAFHMKMIMALLLLPVMVIVYLLCAPASVPRRVADAALLSVATLAASTVWMLFVTFIPLGGRPHVDGSTSDSLWEMVFVYNGFGRIADQQSGGANPLPFGGEPGLARLFNAQLGGQISWLLPFALLALAVGLWTTRAAPRTDPARAGWLLWGGWLGIYAMAISAASGIHPYYSAILAPAVAALAGAGVVMMAGAWQEGHRIGWVLPAGLAITSGWALVVLSRTPDEYPWLRPLVAVAGSVTVLVLVLGQLAPGAGWAQRARRARWMRAVAATGAITVIASPAAWAVSTLRVPPGGASPSSMDTFSPMAGPRINPFAAAAGKRGAPGSHPGGATAVESGRAGGWQTGAPQAGSSRPKAPGGWSGVGRTDPRLLAYLRGQHGGERYLFATVGGIAAAPYISDGVTVLPIGGWRGSGPVPGTTELDRLVATGQLRYVQLSSLTQTTLEQGASDPDTEARQKWVAERCTVVDPAAYGNGDGSGAGGTLYDCGPFRR